MITPASSSRDQQDRVGREMNIKPQDIIAAPNATGARTSANGQKQQVTVDKPN
jgi:hypothetical protein